jgi:ribonuclease HI
MILRVFTDGGSLNNPGKAASAYLIYKEDQLMTKSGKYIGIKTNNTAEYQALIMAWEKIIELYKVGKLKQIEKIEFYSDSLLLVNQLLGFYKIKNKNLKEYYLQIKKLEKEIPIEFFYIHILREKNHQADLLVKKILYS